MARLFGWALQNAGMQQRATQSEQLSRGGGIGCQATSSTHRGTGNWPLYPYIAPTNGQFAASLAIHQRNALVHDHWARSRARERPVGCRKDFAGEVARLFLTQLRGMRGLALTHK
jgi:hypothetical protein